MQNADGAVVDRGAVAGRVQALAGGLSGWALGWIGYQASAGRDGTAQDPGVLESLYSLARIGPALLLAGLYAGALHGRERP